MTLCSFRDQCNSSQNFNPAHREKHRFTLPLSMQTWAFSTLRKPMMQRPKWAEAAAGKVQRPTLPVRPNAHPFCIGAGRSCRRRSPTAGPRSGATGSMQRSTRRRNPSDRAEDDPFGLSPLTTAASWGAPDATFLLLLKHGANVAHATDDGYTALHFAAIHGHPRLIKLLGAHSAPVNAQNNVGRTALHKSADRGRPDCAAALLGLGAPRPYSGSAPTRRCATRRARLRRSSPRRRRRRCVI